MTMLLACLLGIVAGLRTMMAPAAVAWAALLGSLPLEGSWLAFLASPWAVGLLTIMALGELVTDQLPATPSRKVPIQFGGRIASGALAGAAIGVPADAVALCLLAGAAGAVLGTLPGHAFRTRLAAAFGRDRPAALIEDAIAIGGAVLVVAAL